MSQHSLNNHKTAVGRWAGLGPYYAMFPTDFAFQVIEEFSRPGDAVFDPFAGRASSIYAASMLQREAVGIEINPVGWLYGRVKLKPASKNRVLARVKEVGTIADDLQHLSLNGLHEFFHRCYSRRVLNYLLHARDLLDWKKSAVDATLMALILVNLHGKKEGSLSNQMRQGKAMSPDYSVRWWKAHNSEPPEINPIDFLCKRIEWRYAKGLPAGRTSSVILGDSTKIITRIGAKVEQGKQRPFNLLFTSPPYREITDYHYDQWLRLWMLGGPAWANRTGKQWQGRFSSAVGYRELLKLVFSGCADLLSANAYLYVRTDARPFTFETTRSVLQETFPEKCIKIIKRPYSKSTQTALFGDDSKKPGEIDLILRPN